MIHVSAGMPRSGSGWVYNLAADLLAAAGRPPSSVARQQHGLERVLDSHNNRLERATWRAVLQLTSAHRRGADLAVKTHDRPTLALRWAVRRGVMRCHHSYRDPRDVVLSAWEAGEQRRARGQTTSFAALRSVPDVIDACVQWCRTVERWQAYGRALAVRYESLKADTTAVARRLAEHHGLTLDDEQIAAIVGRFAEARPAPGVHFRKGLCGRFREALSPEHLALCRSKLGPFIEHWGYDLD